MLFPDYSEKLISKYDPETNKEYFILKNSEARNVIKLNVYDYKELKITEILLTSSSLKNLHIHDLIVYKTTFILISLDKKTLYVSVNSGETFSLHRLDTSIENIVYSQYHLDKIISINSGNKMYLTNINPWGWNIYRQDYIKLHWYL